MFRADHTLATMMTTIVTAIMIEEQPEALEAISPTTTYRLIWR